MSERDARIAEIRPCQWNCPACGREMISSGVDMDVFEAVLHRAEAAEAKLAAQDAEIAKANAIASDALDEIRRLTAASTRLIAEVAALNAEINIAIEEMPACRRQHLQGAPLLAIVRETVRHILWLESELDKVRLQAGDRSEP